MKAKSFSAAFLTSVQIIAPVLVQTASQHDEQHPQRNNASSAPGAPRATRIGATGMLGMPMTNMISEGRGTRDDLKLAASAPDARHGSVKRLS